MFNKMYCRLHGRSYYSPSICPDCATEMKAREKNQQAKKLDMIKDGNQQLSPLLSDCPGCGRHSLFYNKYSDSYECLEIERCGFTKGG